MSATNGRAMKTLPKFAIECKCHRSLDLAGWMGEATAEAKNAGEGAVPVVVAKRLGNRLVTPTW